MGQRGRRGQRTARCGEVRRRAGGRVGGWEGGCAWVCVGVRGFLRAGAAGSGDSGDEAAKVGRWGGAPARVVLPLVVAGACRPRLAWVLRVVVRLARPALHVVSRRLVSARLQPEGRGLQPELLGLLRVEPRHGVVVLLPRRLVPLRVAVVLGGDLQAAQAQGALRAHQLLARPPLPRDCGRLLLLLPLRLCGHALLGGPRRPVHRRQLLLLPLAEHDRR